MKSKVKKVFMNHSFPKDTHSRTACQRFIETNAQDSLCVIFLALSVSLLISCQKKGKKFESNGHRPLNQQRPFLPNPQGSLSPCSLKTLHHFLALTITNSFLFPFPLAKLVRSWVSESTKWKGRSFVTQACQLQSIPNIISPPVPKNDHCNEYRPHMLYF